MPLAQLNIARMRFPMDAPGMTSFVSQLADVNAGAESADGPGATSYRILGDDAMIVNLSVWRDLASLRAFVIGHEQHRAALQERHIWFERATEPMTVCWPVEEGHLPSLEEAERMLLVLRREGLGDQVFPFSYRG